MTYRLRIGQVFIVTKRIPELVNSDYAGKYFDIGQKWRLVSLNDAANPSGYPLTLNHVDASPEAIEAGDWCVSKDFLEAYFIKIDSKLAKILYT